ncbi:MAG: GH25 family lysozyme [Verrucomicrobiales bacterium]
MKHLLLLLLVPLLTHCGGSLPFFGGGYGGTSVSQSPAVLNVSGWDPKEVQRRGDRYHARDLTALRKNGAVALIARSAKGPVHDPKFADFIQSAHRQGMLIGAYHFVTLDQSPTRQAENFVAHVRAAARARGIRGTRLLLVGDFDTNSTPDRLVDFITRVHQLTGVYPVTYLENSDQLRARLSAARPEQKALIRRSPYWLALYSPKGTERTMAYTSTLTPDSLTKLYGIWPTWAMWQYGGVVWENGKSSPKHYDTPAWRSPRYFGNMAHPMERNVFKGSPEDLQRFWQAHSISL